MFLFLKESTFLGSVDCATTFSSTAVRRLTDHELDRRRVKTRPGPGNELQNRLRGSVAELADRLPYAGQGRKPVSRRRQIVESHQRHIARHRESLAVQREAGAISRLVVDTK